MTTQIAVKLPDEVVVAVDRLVSEGRFPNRSATVRRALDVLLASVERESVDQAFARGFGATPETVDELADAARLAVDAIEDEPWEKWW